MRCSLFTCSSARLLHIVISHGAKCDAGAQPTTHSPTIRSAGPSRCYLHSFIASVVDVCVNNILCPRDLSLSTRIFFEAAFNVGTTLTNAEFAQFGTCERVNESFLKSDLLHV